MRTTLLVILCSTASACAQIGDRTPYEENPDAGIDGGAVTATCDNLETRTGSINIAGTQGFTGLPTKCWKLTGKLTIMGPAVTSLDRLGDLRGVGDLEIYDTELTKIDSKTQIDVTGDVYIHNNAKLTDVGNIVPKVSLRSLRVESNAALTMLGGLSSVPLVTGATTISNNVKLQSISFPAAQRLEGGLTVTDNAAATSILLNSLQSVGNLTISRNNLVTSIGGMQSMTYLHGSLTVDSNASLTTLGTIGMNLGVDLNVTITNNARLNDVGNISHATGIGGTLNISSNPVLPMTQVHDVGCCVNVPNFISNQTGSCGGNHWCQNTHACYWTF